MFINFQWKYHRHKTVFQNSFYLSAARPERYFRCLHPSLCLSVRPTVRPSVRLTVRPTVRPSVHMTKLVRPTTREICGHSLPIYLLYGAIYWSKVFWRLTLYLLKSQLFFVGICELISLGMGSANERRRYIVPLYCIHVSYIGWVHTQNDALISHKWNYCTQIAYHYFICCILMVATMRNWLLSTESKRLCSIIISIMRINLS